VAAWEAVRVVVRSGRLTSAGEVVTDALQDSLRRLLAEPVSITAGRAAENLSSEHRTRHARQ
jgi:Arc/MetJ-type ribon-helix-helix transcriptional regulator